MGPMYLPFCSSHIFLISSFSGAVCEGTTTLEKQAEVGALTSFLQNSSIEHSESLELFQGAGVR